MSVFGSLGRSFRSMLPLMTAAAALVVAFVGLQVRPDLSGEFGALGVVVANTVAGVLMLRASARPGSERAAWRFMGFAFIMSAMGVIAVGIASTVGTVPAFGPLDVFFLGAYTLLVLGITRLPQVAGDWRQRLRMLLDGAVGAAALATLAWVLFIYEIFEGLASAPLAERLIGSMYPLLDVTLIVTAMAVIVRRSNYRFDVRLLALGVGLSFQAFADLSYLLSGVGKSFNDATPNFLLFLGASAGYLAASAVVHREPNKREAVESATPWWSVAAPYGVAMAMVALLLVDQVRDETYTHRGLVIGTLLVGGLVIGRQAIAIQENRVLVEEQRAALVSSISHELRTPLTAMVGFLSLIDDDEEMGLSDAERSEMVGIVRNQAEYMAGIVTDLVMLAREDPSQIVLAYELTSINEVVGDAINAASVSADEIQTDVDKSLEAMIDRGRIQQVLVNLISNSVRYGGPSRLVRSYLQDGDVVFEVHDDGPGVPKKYELAVFRRFERGANKLNAQVQGSGIGLAVVAAIAKAHNGHVEYRQSELLGGACFALTLPWKTEARHGLGSSSEVREPAGVMP